jgi:hypothetical protein
MRLSKTTFAALMIVSLLLPLACGAENSAPNIAPNDERIQLSGRWDTKNAAPTSPWSGVAIRFHFSGAACSAIFTTSGDDYIAVCVDGKFVSKIHLTNSKDPIVIADKLQPGEHDVDIIKATHHFRRARAS